MSAYDDFIMKSRKCCVMNTYMMEFVMEEGTTPSQSTRHLLLLLPTDDGDSPRKLC